MNPVLRNSADPVRHPVLSRLIEKLSLHRRHQLTAAFTRAVLEAFSLQILLLMLFGWLSSLHPYQPVFPKLCLATYLLYLWPLAVWVQALGRGSFRIAALAARLDEINAGSPDIFRTVLSLGNHSEATLDALNRYYEGLENTLRIPKPHAGSRRIGLLVLCVSLALTLPLFSGHYGDVLRRMANPVAALENIPLPRLSPIEVPARAALGDTVRIAVRVEKLPASEPVYAHIRVHGKEQRFRMEREGDLARFQNGPVQGDFKLYFSALSVTTSEYSVHAVPSPYLRSLSVVTQSPGYTHNPAEALPEMPATLTALPGSRISWKAEASQPLEKLLAIFRETGSSRFDTVNLGDGEVFSFQRVVHKSVEVRFRLFAAEDKLTGHAGPYRIEPGVDAYPEIAFLSPSQDGELGRTLKTPLVFRAHDDFGVSRVILNYSVLDGQTVKSKGALEVTSWLKNGGMGAGVWEMEALALQPGDVAEIFLQAVDNDAVSGPKSSVSRTLRLRLPSPEEILEQINAGERNASTSLKSAAERVERIKQAQQQAEESHPDAPATLGPWEIRAILSAAPQDHLQRLDRHLQAEVERVNKSSPQDKQLGRQLESLRKDVKAMAGRLPPPDAFQKPVAEQRRLLDTLMKDQQSLDQKLSELKPLTPPDKNVDVLALERQSLQAELKQHLKEQQDLKSWLKDREQDLNSRQKNLEQAAQAGDRAREDVQKALSEMQKALQKGMENGALTPDLLEKMNRIQDLLKEALPDSLREQMQRDMQDQQVGAQDLEENLKNMLNRQENVREGLDRAIRMLEMLRDLHALEALSKDLHELRGEEENLARQISKPGEDPGEVEARQADIRKQLEKDLEEMDRLASEQKAFKDLKNQKSASDARNSMQQAEKSLKKKTPQEKSKAAQNAKDAAEDLAKASQDMDDMMAQMQGGPEPSEISDLLSETLEFSRWLDLIRNREDRLREGWEEDDPALNQRAVQLTRWLTARMKRLAAGKPYESEALRRESAAMSFQADALMTVSFPPPVDSLMIHTRKAARELLKWLQNANDEEERSMAGSGSGSGKKKSGKGKGKGQGEGEGSGDDESLDGLAGRLRGVSGKQMAVNQSTYQLLKSFLEGRHQNGNSPGSSGMPMPGGNQSGSRGAPMPGQGQPGGQSGQNGNPGGDQNGNGNPSASANGNGANGPNGAAGSQQGVGESLERMAESASDAGGSARKLRMLAEEARSLEKDLRQGRIDPEELRKKQERFQTRLLEAANSMEERGEDRQRQAQAYQGGALKPGPALEPERPDVFQELERRRAWVRDLPLSAEQRRHLEQYYESLLTR